MMGGSVVSEWDQVIRHISVSSNENQVSRLIDGSDKTYWQSSGAQGKVSCTMYTCYCTCVSYKENE